MDYKNPGADSGDASLPRSTVAVTVTLDRNHEHVHSEQCNRPRVARHRPRRCQRRANSLPVDQLSSKENFDHFQATLLHRKDLFVVRRAGAAFAYRQRCLTRISHAVFRFSRSQNRALVLCTEVTACAASTSTSSESSSGSMLSELALPERREPLPAAKHAAALALSRAPQGAPPRGRPPVNGDFLPTRPRDKQWLGQVSVTWPIRRRRSIRRTRARPCAAG